MDNNTKQTPSSATTVAINGLKIKEFRESKGLTQLYVATVLGVTTDTISRWENGRSPSIKLENAEKLAEVLEVPLDTILNPTETTAPDHDKDAEGAAPFPSWNVRLAIGLALIICVFTTWWYWQNAPTRAHGITATRFLPSHASRSQPFPVVIRVESSSDTVIPFILTETLPPGCSILNGSPPFSGQTSTPATIKWLSSTDDYTLYFAYLVQADNTVLGRDQLQFDGRITIGRDSRASLPITGSNGIAMTNFHWADTNKDQRIDDSEILSIYHSFDVLLDIGMDIDAIRDIWASKGYQWNEAGNRFDILN